MRQASGQATGHHWLPKRNANSSAGRNQMPVFREARIRQDRGRNSQCRWPSGIAASEREPGTGRAQGELGMNQPADSQPFPLHASSCRRAPVLLALERASQEALQAATFLPKPGHRVAPPPKGHADKSLHEVSGNDDGISSSSSQTGVFTRGDLTGSSEHTKTFLW